MYKSFTFTIRPRDGFPQELDCKVIKWCQQQTGAFLCYEKEGIERHLHGQVWLQEAREKGTINRSLERICATNVKDWDNAQSIILRRGTKIAYNDDFVVEYLSKEDNILLNKPPDEDTEDYYPSQEEQEKVKAKANATDQYYHTMNESLKEYKEEFNIEKVTRKIVADFMSYQIYHKKTHKIIRHKRDRVEITNNLYNYHTENFNSWKEFLTADDVMKYTEKNID